MGTFSPACIAEKQQFSPPKGSFISTVLYSRTGYIYVAAITAIAKHIPSSPQPRETTLQPITRIYKINTTQPSQKKACSAQLLSAFNALPLSVVLVLRTESGVRLRFSFARIVFRSPLHQFPPSACQTLGEEAISEAFGGEESGEKDTPGRGSCQLLPAAWPPTLPSPAFDEVVVTVGASADSATGSTSWTLRCFRSARGELGR